MYGDRVMLYNWMTCNLDSIQKKRKELGADVKIVTETQARRIVEMRELDAEYRARQSKQAVLHCARKMPELRRHEAAIRILQEVQGVYGARTGTKT